jgi:hypothetical protein
MQPVQPLTVPVQGKQPDSKPANPVQAPLPIDAELLQQIAGGLTPAKGW